MSLLPLYQPFLKYLPTPQYQPLEVPMAKLNLDIDVRLVPLPRDNRAEDHHEGALTPGIIWTQQSVERHLALGPVPG